ncbi:hypothetical protein NHQ30_004856 [Ciborinia camelliae]|nr:hypothetical protein NHQ30_004856 [Ciborinia camelliae]
MPPRSKPPTTAIRGSSNTNSNARSAPKSTPTTTPRTSTPNKKPGPARRSKQQPLAALTFPIYNNYEDEKEKCKCPLSHSSLGLCEAEKARKDHVNVSMSIILSSPHTTTLLIGPDAQPFTIYTSLLTVHTNYFTGQPQLAAFVSPIGGQPTKRTLSLPDFRIPKKVKIDEQGAHTQERSLDIVGVLSREDCFFSRDVKPNLNMEKNSNDNQALKFEESESKVAEPKIKLEPNSTKETTPPKTPSPEPPIMELANLFGFTQKVEAMKRETTPPSPRNFKYPKITVIDFAHFQSWMLTGTLIPSLNHLVDPPSKSLTTSTLITLHVFSHTIKCAPFGIFILQTLLNHQDMISKNWPSPSDARLIYSITHTSSILRKLCADCLANNNPFDKEGPSSAIYKKWEDIFAETKISMDFAKASTPRWHEVDPWTWSERNRYFGNEVKGIGERWEDMLNDGNGGEEEIREDGEKGRFAKRVELEFLRNMEVVNPKKRKRDESVNSGSSDDDSDEDEEESGAEK